MATKKRRGRPKGSKNNNFVVVDNDWMPDLKKQSGTVSRLDDMFTVLENEIQRCITKLKGMI